MEKLTSHLDVTFGSATVRNYIEILDQSCQSYESSTLEQVLTRLGYGD